MEHTLQRKMFPSIFQSPRTPSEPGSMQERSELFFTQAENDSTTDKTASTSYQGQEAPRPKRKSPTQESLHPSEKKTFISDIGSGVNFNRKGLRRFLESLCEATFDQALVAHRDYFAHFAFGLIEFVCRQSRCHVVVHLLANMGESERDRLNERSEYLLAVTTHITAQDYGQRSTNNRHQRAHGTRNEQVGCVGDTDISTRKLDLYHQVPSRAK